MGKRERERERRRERRREREMKEREAIYHRLLEVGNEAQESVRGRARRSELIHTHSELERIEEREERKDTEK